MDSFTKNGVAQYISPTSVTSDAAGQCPIDLESTDISTVCTETG